MIFGPEQVEKFRRGVTGAELEIQVEEDGDHCCHNMGHIVRPRMADWLADRLGQRPVKPPPFDYAAPESLDEAIGLLAGDLDAKLLAGGQSLVPLLSMRLAYPDLLVDLRRVAGLDTISESDGHLVIGAMVRQLQAETSDTVAARCPLIVQALRQVAHPQIRARGTVGGSIAHADPAGELPAVALALDARARVRGPGWRAPRARGGPLPRDLHDLARRGRDRDLGRVPDRGTTERARPAWRSRGGRAITRSAARSPRSSADRRRRGGRPAGAASASPTGRCGPPGRRPRCSETPAERGAGASRPRMVAEEIAFADDPQVPADYRRQVAAVSAQRAIAQALEAAA